MALLGTAPDAAGEELRAMVRQAWEPLRPGYLLRLAREEAGLSQAELARKLGVTQQAVARAERWDSNPTVGLLERWAEACGDRLRIELVL